MVTDKSSSELWTINTFSKNSFAKNEIYDLQQIKNRCFLTGIMLSNTKGNLLYESIVAIRYAFYNNSNIDSFFLVSKFSEKSFGRSGKKFIETEFQRMCSTVSLLTARI